MKKSTDIGMLAKALGKVQSQLKGAKEDSENPFFHSKYADLSSVWKTCRNLLTENELVVIQTTSVGENQQLIVETMLVHSSGEWIMGEMPMILAKQDPQGIGSAITYGRRYGLSAIIGICPEDDDAEGAMDRSKIEYEITPQGHLPNKEKITQAQTKKLYAVANQMLYSNELVTSIMIRKFNTGRSTDLTKSQASELIQLLESGYELKGKEKTNDTNQRETKKDMSKM